MNKTWLTCVSGLGVVLTSANVAAQETGLQLEEIVVTATKRETDLQKTSISIQTYSGEELKKQGKKRLDEIMQGVVGVQVQGGIVGSNFYMRGVDAGGGAGSQSTVAVLIDGVYQNRGEVVRGGSLDVAQVEVSRGTQSTNLGASAIAGAISLVSNQPVFEYQASGSLETGSYDLLNLEGVLNVPVADNQAVRVAYSNSKRNGYYKSGVGDSDLQTARVKYRWKISDAINTVFTVSQNKVGGNGSETGALLARGQWQAWSSTYNSYRNGTGNVGCGSTVVGVQLIGCPTNYFADYRVGQYYFERNDPWNDNHPGVFPNNPFRHTKITDVSAEVTWDLGFGSLKLTPATERTTFQSNETPFNGTTWGAENRLQKTRSFEAQLSSPSGSALQWMAGLYYYWTNQTGTMLTTTAPGAGATLAACSATGNIWCYTWTADQEVKQETKSAYANASYSMTDALRFTGGLRYARDDKSYISNQNTAGTGTGTIAGDQYGPTAAFNYACLNIASGSNCGKAVWHATTYSAGVEYDVLPQSMVYAKYSTGYQPGAVSAMTGISKKLTTEQITLGIKNRFFDNKLQVNLEAFDSVYHNRPVQGGIGSVSTGANPNCTFTTNPATSWYLNLATDGSACLYYSGGATAPKVISRGVDFELNFVPTSNDRVDLSMEYLDSSFISSPTVDLGYPTVASIMALNSTLTSAQAQQLLANFNSQIEGYKGAVLQNASKWSGSFSYSHRFALSGGSSLTPKLSSTYKSKYWTLNGPSANINVARPAMENGHGRYYADGTFAPGIQPSYSLFDAYTTWESADGKYSLTGSVKNIQNRPILAGASTTTVGGAVIPRSIYLLPPRTLGLNFTANF